MALLGFVVVASWAIGCLNDRDSLMRSGEQDITLADTRALVGWFDRFPKRYYEMRIERLKKLTSLTPGEYDDISVAYDRIGESQKAIVAITPKIKLKNLTVPDRYSYYANHGTFLAHDWIRKGRHPENLDQLRLAVKEIATAIDLNPTAHYGREGTQLEVLRWLLMISDPDLKIAAPTLGEHLEKTIPEAAEVGLKGLIMQGNAWESPDVVAAISYLAVEKVVSAVANHRYQELLASGKTPIYDLLASSDLKIDKYVQVNEDSFKSMRSAAEARMTKKAEYMEIRMDKGDHPDTTPQFWAEWSEPMFEPVTPPRQVRLGPKSDFQWGTNEVIGAISVTFIILFVGSRVKARLRSNVVKH